MDQSLILVVFLLPFLPLLLFFLTLKFLSPGDPETTSELLKFLPNLMKALQAHTFTSLRILQSHEILTGVPGFA